MEIELCFRKEPIKALQPASQTNITCMAKEKMPGEHISLIDHVVYIDGKRISDPETVFFPSIIQIKSKINVEDAFRKTGIEEYFNLGNGRFKVHASKAKIEILKRNIGDKIEITQDTSTVGKSSLFPPHHPDNWSTGNYGPLYIPKKGSRGISGEK